MQIYCNMEIVRFSIMSLNTSQYFFRHILDNLNILIPTLSFLDFSQNVLEIFYHMSSPNQYIFSKSIKLNANFINQCDTIPSHVVNARPIIDLSNIKSIRF